MGGGHIQLVAYGAQDEYLTGNPQITFFKAVYKKYTNFAIENFNMIPIGTLKWGNKLTFNIDRKGDLLGGVYLEFILEFLSVDNKKLSFQEIRQELIKSKTLNNLSKSLGYSFINYIDVEIGGTTIDTQTGHWMAIKNELNKEFNKQINNLFLTHGFNRAAHISENAISIIIPLDFWFNTNPGLFLPLIALQYHEVKINVKLNSLDNLLLNNDRTIKNIHIVELNMVADYIFLDNAERKLFAQSPHDYLIEQHQFLPEYSHTGNNSINISLPFNHPIKQIVWTLHDRSLTKDLGLLWSGQKDRINQAKIQLNGIDRFHEKPGYYFQTLQKYTHTNGLDLHKFFSEMMYMYQIPNIDNSALPTTALDSFCYNFCLNNGSFQPCGSCNFSRLDNATLNILLNNDIPTKLDQEMCIKIYGVNYNILKITNGMGGILYQN
uniref:Major capsid protein N-terminal domain-containing protein n=1 Tax=viral metagenome TaxID=1070528 RepID=A0A6C0EI31_9ZZZZ